MGAVHLDRENHRVRIVGRGAKGAILNLLDCLLEHNLRAQCVPVRDYGLLLRAVVPAVQLHTPTALLQHPPVLVHRRLSVELIAGQIRVVAGADEVMAHRLRHVILDRRSDPQHLAHGVKGRVCVLVKHRGEVHDSHLRRKRILRQPPNLLQGVLPRHLRLPPLQLLLVEPRTQLLRIHTRGVRVAGDRLLQFIYDGHDLGPKGEEVLHALVELLLVHHPILVPIILPNHVRHSGVAHRDVHSPHDQDRLPVRKVPSSILVGPVPLLLEVGPHLARCWRIFEPMHKQVQRLHPHFPRLHGRRDQVERALVRNDRERALRLSHVLAAKRLEIRRLLSLSHVDDVVDEDAWLLAEDLVGGASALPVDHIVRGREVHLCVRLLAVSRNLFEGIPLAHALLAQGLVLEEGLGEVQELRVVLQVKRVDIVPLPVQLGLLGCGEPRHRPEPGQRRRIPLRA
mmetsp:Transcript_66796/g.164630  ORF Transcript_66796/g.164630 Transcript_66796/m.164630 type:complete len:455 (-) Transcript_66796:109-1473(-)